MKIRWVLWIAAILLFSALGLLFALPSLSSANWQRVLLGSLIQWWSWGLIAPLIPWIDMRLPFKENQLLKRVLAHIPGSVIVTIFYSCIVRFLGLLVGLINWSVIASKPFLGNLAPSLLWNWLVYWVIFGVLQTFSYYQRYLASELRAARMERSSSEARLNALRMQLNPHFLFNALNTISSQGERDPRLARGMIEHLGGLVRLSRESKDKQEVPLAEEMEFLEHYVAIQKIRFGEHLRIEVAVTPEARTASVPSLFLQPLVENAIRHGVSRRASGGNGGISAGRVDG